MASDEQAALQEKVKKMSPDELREYQKKNCIFCQIIAGKVASKKVYADDKVFAILDINPANPGHILVLPKEHYAIMPVIPDPELGYMAMVAKALSHTLLKVLQAGGTTIFIANGSAAGQKAQHFMVHIIPRKENDDVGLMIPQNNISEQDLDALQQRLATRVQELLGGTSEFSKPPFTEQKPHAEEIKPIIQKISGSPILVPEDEKFITSNKAKRYHQSKCPFAQNIPKEDCLYGSREELENKGKKPCTCVTGKKIPLTKANHQKKPIIVDAEFKDQKKNPTNSRDIDLNNISKLFLGK